MAVELYVNDNPIELKQDAEITFNFTISDIFSLGGVASSYSNIWQAPLTPQNTMALNGLGLVGSSSQIPYKNVNVKLKNDGIDIIKHGILVVEECGDNYRMATYEGAIDFFNAIENKFIGVDLDISELKHNKTLEAVVNSFSEGLYKYVVADFNGKNQLLDRTVNIDYLIPMVPFKYFWDKIFEFSGFTYSGTIFSDPDFLESHITYPKAPDLAEDVIEVVAQATKGQTTDNFPVFIANNRYEFPNSQSWTSGVAQEGEFVNNWNYRAGTDDTFRFSFKPIGNVRYTTQSGGIGFDSFRFEIWQGTNLLFWKASKASNDDQWDEYFFDIPLSVGQEVQFKISYQGLTPSYLNLSFLDITVYKKSLGTFDFQDAFKEFSMKDFVKEIVWRFGLTPVYDGFRRHLTFYTLKEKVNFNNYLNWTDKYVQRSKESYIFNSFAQKNTFEHKYNNEGESYNNGSINILNANIPATKVVAQSKIYSANSGFSTLDIGGNTIRTSNYPMWTAELKEVVDNNVYKYVIQYKGLSGRYYVMRVKEVNQQGKFKSEILDSTTSFPNKYLVTDNINTHYVDLVAKYYPIYEKMLNDFKLHEIELALNAADVSQLDFMKVYYFEQEASFYVLNKLTWTEGKTCIGEFIKLKR
ncbi:hypothetical protein [Paenimyroides ceti]